MVNDNCDNTIVLNIGTAPGATECYDAGFDIEAPPPPPPGAFDGRLVSWISFVYRYKREQPNRRKNMGC